MDNKTISHLNTKIWYRFLKVVYSFAIVIISLIAIILIYQEKSQEIKLVDNNKTIILCNYGNKKQFTASQAGIYLTTFETESNFLSNDDRIALEEFCQVSQAEENFVSDAITNHTDNVKKLFTITPIIKNEGGIISVLGYSILTLITILIIFEVIKRVFYYIFLGSIRPEK